MAETVFQANNRKYDAWVEGGKQGKAPARLAFDHAAVRAWVDPFRKLPGTIVVVPLEGTPKVSAYVHDLPEHRQHQMTLVRNAITRKMLAETGLRPIEHTEGYGVDDHAHVVVFPAERGAGKALYEQVPRPDEETLEAELDRTLGLYGIRGVEADLLGQRLDAMESMAVLLDEPRLPQGTPAAVARLADRAILCT